MNKSTKIWIIIAVLLLLIGCMMFGGVMSMLQWDFTKLSTVSYETNHYEPNGDYKGISIVTDTANIEFLPAQDEVASVVCYEQKNATHSVTVKDDTLMIELVDTRKWYERIGLSYQNAKITLSLPQKEFDTLTVKVNTGDVNMPEDFRFRQSDVKTDTGRISWRGSVSESLALRTTTGDIRLDKVNAGAIRLSATTGAILANQVVSEKDCTLKATTGRIELSDFSCNSLTATNNTGRIILKDTVAADRLAIENSTGSILFDRADAASITAQTNTGRISGTLRSEKVFIAETSTGKIRVPKTVSGGRCELSTGTGNIEIDILEK